jgi:hypothetical protein
MLNPNRFYLVSVAITIVGEAFLQRSTTKVSTIVFQGLMGAPFQHSET